MTSSVTKTTNQVQANLIALENEAELIRSHALYFQRRVEELMRDEVPRVRDAVSAGFEAFKDRIASLSVGIHDQYDMLGDTE